MSQAALDKTDDDRTAMSSLLAYLTTNEVISHEQAKKGFDRLYEVSLCAHDVTDMAVKHDVYFVASQLQGGKNWFDMDNSRNEELPTALFDVIFDLFCW